jgi:hypothetical protein
MGRIAGHRVTVGGKSTLFWRRRMQILRPQLIAVATVLIIAGSADVAFAQGYQVSGTVSAADATPLAEVSVRLKRMNVGCVTTLSGAYQLTARNAADTLVFTKRGFDPVQVPITTVDDLVTSSRNIIHVALRPQVIEPRPAVTGQDTRPGAPAALQIRNQGEPLYLIDGVLSDSASFNALSPHVIETVSLMRNEASLQRFGEAGRNGVVVITTKPECEPAP